MFGYIYKITNLINNKIYIGKREKAEFDESYWGSGRHITASIKKYGKEHFAREIVEWCDTRDQLCAREQYWVEALNCRDPNIGYNIVPGGLGAKLYGERNGMFGKHHTEATKQKMSMSHPKEYPPEFGHKISNSLKGHVISEETKEKIRLKNLNKVPWNKGLKNPYSDETRQKMSISAQKRGMSKERHAKAAETIKSRHYHWYNNGVETAKFSEGMEPTGWVRGRIYEFTNKLK